MLEDKFKIEQAMQQGALMSDHHHTVRRNAEIAEQDKHDTSNFNAGCAIATLGVAAAIGGGVLIDDSAVKNKVMGGALMGTTYGVGAAVASLNSRRRKPENVGEIEQRLRGEGIAPPVGEDKRYLGNGVTAIAPGKLYKDWQITVSRDRGNISNERG